MQINTTDNEAGKTLYMKVRVGFFSQGDSLNAWCKRNDYHLSNVREALHGLWNGPRGKAIRAEAVKASKANIKEETQ